MSNSIAFGVVIIGRNEGERLVTCLKSNIDSATSIIYVDSGSSDGSIAAAQELGASVVTLDSTSAFSAARARNAGTKKLQSINPDLQYVQFVDGDCEISPGWFQAGLTTLEEKADVAIVCGRLQERFPERSIYNRLCDMEWNRPAGQVDSCGGLFMMRLSIFNQLGGFKDALIAGEEPELCLRVRRAGWQIERLATDMAKHDAAMTKFSQWWQRAKRSGHAYAESMSTYGRDVERVGVRESASIWLWSTIIPFGILFFMLTLSMWSALLFLLYPYKVWRIAKWYDHDSNSTGNGWLFSYFCMLGKWPQALGQGQFWINKLRQKKVNIIEYK